jgi:hypothetical protein
MAEDPRETEQGSEKVLHHLNKDQGQRWEKREGMPVYRHLHRMGSVYTFSSELDAWAQSRKLPLEEEEKGLRAERPADGEVDLRPTGTSRTRLWLVDVQF